MFSEDNTVHNSYLYFWIVSQVRLSFLSGQKELVSHRHHEGKWHHYYDQRLLLEPLSLISQWNKRQFCESSLCNKLISNSNKVIKDTRKEQNKSKTNVHKNPKSKHGMWHAAIPADEKSVHFFFQLSGLWDGSTPRWWWWRHVHVAVNSNRKTRIFQPLQSTFHLVLFRLT